MDCEGSHNCIAAGVAVLSKIVFTTETCTGCQGTAVEDGPILEIIGGQTTSGVTSCTTQKLDHEAEVDYAPGNEAVFKDTTDKDALGTCYKVNIKHLLFFRHKINN